MIRVAEKRRKRERNRKKVLAKMMAENLPKMVKIYKRSLSTEKIFSIIKHWEM